MIWMQIESVVLGACITIFSLGMLIVSLLSYRKYKNIKLIFVSSAFLIFFIKGIILSLSLFYEEMAVINSSTYTGILDLIILILLFMATLKR